MQSIVDLMRDQGLLQVALFAYTHTQTIVGGLDHLIWMLMRTLSVAVCKRGLTQCLAGLQGMDAQSSAQLTLVIRQVLPLIPELAPGLGYTGEGHRISISMMMVSINLCLLQL